MNQKNLNPLAELPMGLGMALSQNPGAMAYFTGLSPERQRDVIEHTHSIHSKGEMQSYVRHLADGQ